MNTKIKQAAAVLAGVKIISLICLSMSSGISGTLFKKSLIFGNPGEGDWERHIKSKVSYFSINNINITLQN